MRLSVSTLHSLVSCWMARSELSGAQGKFGGSRVRGEGESDRLGACFDVRFRCIAVVDNTHAALRIEVCGHLKKMLLRRNQLAKALP